MRDFAAVATAIEMSVFTFMVFVIFTYEILLKSSHQLDAHLPRNITALSGSCVEIPCVFDVDQMFLINTGGVYGFWIKTDHAFQDPPNVVVFNGRTNTTKVFSHIEIIGNLRKNECSTVFYDVMKNYSDNYYFRVEKTEQGNDWKYTYINPVYISVSDLPQTPILKPANLNETEGRLVNLSCSAKAPCPKQPPTISWSNISESANTVTTQLLENPDKTQSVFSHMTFNASYRDHGKNISCTVTYPRKKSNDSTVETTMTLRVQFSPKETQITIDPSASVTIGMNVTLTCRSTANPSDNINYTWYKHGQEKQLAFGEKLTFMNIDAKNGGLYFCKAETILGNQKSEGIQLIVEGAASLDSLYLIIACVGGVSLFLFLFLLISLFLRVRRVKSFISREPDSDQDQKKDVPISTVYVNSAFVPFEEPEMPKPENEMIHYGEIDFSGPITPTPTVQSSGLETIYAEVSNPTK